MASGRCYVGQSANIGQRWKEHRSRLKLQYHRSPQLQAAFNKYGVEAFEWSVLEECSPESLTEREQYWIDLLRPAFNTAPAAGSTLGMRRPDVSVAKKGVPRPATVRAKISAAHQGMRKPWLDGNQYGKANKGYKQTPEQIAKLSLARMGNKNNLGHTLSPETRAKIGAKSREAWVRRRALAALEGDAQQDQSCA
jgi:group I intron endonuclease